jgi:hypothetical protein
MLQKWPKNEFEATNTVWLVVATPLKNISQLGLLFPIYGKIFFFPNHQPGLVFEPKM